MAPTLRVTTPGETKPPKPEPKTIAEAAKKGTKRQLLVTMRDRVATAITKADCPARELGTLTKRLTDIVSEIEALDVREESDLEPRLRELETALREAAPDHPLLVGVDVVDDHFDADAI